MLKGLASGLVLTAVAALAACSSSPASPGASSSSSATSSTSSPSSAESGGATTGAGTGESVSTGGAGGAGAVDPEIEIMHQRADQAIETLLLDYWPQLLSDTTTIDWKFPHYWDALLDAAAYVAHVKESAH